MKEFGMGQDSRGDDFHARAAATGTAPADAVLSLVLREVIGKVGGGAGL